MQKNLIIYYSRRGTNYVNGEILDLPVGNTELCARYIQEAVGGDLFEVRTKVPYSLDYKECTRQAWKEVQDNSRPLLETYLEDVSGYNNIFVLGPCWCGTYPMAVFSLLDRLDLTGKKLFPLMTHEGSGMGNSERDLRRLYPKASFGTGMAIHGADAKKAQQAVADWAKKNI